MASKSGSVNVKVCWLGLSSVAGLVVFGITPGLSQVANFGSLTLTAEKNGGMLTGSTGGSTSLPAITSNRDRHNNPCLGFGDPTPDHILILQQPFPQLALKVNSGGFDTTLVIQGSDGVMRCGNDTGPKKDAGITDTDWAAGSYKIWVGTADPGMQRNYTLTVRAR